MSLRKYVDEEQLNNVKTALADSLWQDIAGYSTTRRNIAQNSKLSAYSFTGTNNYCNKLNDSTWSMYSSVQYAGIQIDGSLFEEGETYTLSYRYRKQSGTLENMGGHSTGFTTLLATIDETPVESNESTGTNSYGNVFPVADDNNEHYVSITLRLDNIDSLTHLYIQPNRGKETPVGIRLMDIKLEIGNTATPWTPAPEDFAITDTLAKLEARIAALENK